MLPARMALIAVGSVTVPRTRRLPSGPSHEACTVPTGSDQLCSRSSGVPPFWPSCVVASSARLRSPRWTRLPLRLAGGWAVPLKLSTILTPKCNTPNPLTRFATVLYSRFG